MTTLNVNAIEVEEVQDSFDEELNFSYRQSMMQSFNMVESPGIKPSANLNFKNLDFKNTLTKVGERSMQIHEKISLIKSD